MKFTFILRLMTAIAFMASLTPTKVDANFLDSLKKAAGKASKSLQKAAHGPIGKMAMQAGGAAVAAKYGPEAGGMFQGAAQSMHLADEADAAADEADANAAQAEDDGDMDTAAQHKTTAKMHRATAASHRADHAVKKKAYEAAGGNFDADYAEHVGKKLKKAAAKYQDDDEDDSDSDGDSGDDSDGDGDGGDDEDDE
jgi:hypothetical protein